MPAFRSRFEQCVRKVKKHHVNLPEEALGFLFLKQSKIQSESLERLITLTSGDLKYDAVVDGLRRLKMRLLDGDETATHKKKHLWLNENADEPGLDGPDLEGHSQDDEMDAIEQAIADLEDESEEPHAELSEDGAREVLMTLIKQQINKPNNMSYKQVQQQKKDVRNSRGYRSFPNASGSAGPMRRDLQHLKSITRCKNCGELGHWHKECPKPSKTPSANRSQANSQASGAAHSWWSHVQPAASAEEHMTTTSHEPGSHVG